MDKFGYGDEDGHAYVTAPFGNGGGKSLQVLDIAPVGGGGHRD